MNLTSNQIASLNLKGKHMAVKFRKRQMMKHFMIIIIVLLTALLITYFVTIHAVGKINFGYASWIETLILNPA